MTAFLVMNFTNLWISGRTDEIKTVLDVYELGEISKGRIDYFIKETMINLLQSKKAKIINYMVDQRNEVANLSMDIDGFSKFGPPIPNVQEGHLLA